MNELVQLYLRPWSDKPFDMSDNNTHGKIVVLFPHLDKLRKFGRRI